MLANMTPSIDPIQILDNSPFTFYLSGSRFFGNTNSRSDWDFFTEDATDIEEYLIEHKFKKLPVNETNYFGTTGIVKIYRLKQVDIHLCQNAKRKNQVQEAIKDIISQTEKREHKQIWTMALRIADALGV